MSPRILISGFGKFPGVSINASEVVVKEIKALYSDHPKLDLKTLILETVYKRSYEELAMNAKRYSADIILAFGIHSQSPGIRLESKARNVYGDKPDCLGLKPAHNIINKQGEDSYDTGLPVDLLKNNLSDAGVSVYISDNAGDYVCNDLFYRMMFDIANKRISSKAGFIHIPFYRELAIDLEMENSQNYMRKEELIKGLDIILNSVIEDFV